MTISDPLRAFAENLPSGWQLLPFEAMLAEPVRNGIYKTKEFHGRGARVVNMGELFGFDFLSGQEMKRVELTADEEKKNGLIDGDLLFARRSLVLEGAGKCSLVVNPPETLTFESSIIRARPKRSAAEPRFLFYLFTSPLGRAIMASIATRTAVSGIRGSDLTQVGLPLPPLPVQRRIAGILTAYDELIENNQRRIRILETMARALYREWFVHFRFPGHEKHPRVASPIGDIPQGWEVKKLGEIANITMGLSPKGNTYNEDGDGTPLVNGPVEFGERFTKLVKWTTAPTKFCKEGDLVVCVRGSTTGKYVKSDGAYCLGRGVCGLSSKYQCFVDLLFENELPTLLGQTSGSTFPSWTGPQLKNHPVLSPPPDLLARFEALVKPMSAAVLENSRKTQTLRRTRDLLLPRLLSGQVDVGIKAV